MSKRLHFMPSPEHVGRPHSLAEFDSKEPELYVRELIQNALDAFFGGKPVQKNQGGGGECCEVRFDLVDLPKSEIPGLADYRKALERGLEAWREKGNPKVIRYLECLEKQSAKSTFKTLVVTDNGAGFSQRGMEAVLSEGTPEKQEGSSGSFGVGHLTAFGLSHLQYLLYIGKNQQSTLYSGHAIVASHPGSDNKNRSAHGYFVDECINDFFHKFRFHDETQLPAKIRANYNELIGETGSMVLIPDFNFFGEDEKSMENMLQVISEAVITNFAIACCSGQLTVRLFNDQVFSKSNIRNLADKMLIDNPDDIKLAKTIANLKTYQLGCDEPANATRLEGEFEDCQILINTQADSHGVSFWRNGMLITRTHLGFAKSRFSDRQAFDAVIKLDGRQPDGYAPTSHDLVRDAETPMHDSIVTKRLKDNPASQKKLASLLDIIRTKLYFLSEPLSSEEFGVDDILVGKGGMGEFVREDRKITVKIVGGDEMGEDGGQAGDEEFIHGENKRTEEEGEPGTSTTEGGGKKEVKTRKNISRQFQQRGREVSPTEWKLQFRPHSDRKKVKAHLFIDDGTDPSCTGKVGDSKALIKSVRVADRVLQVLENNTFEIGDVVKDKSYVLTIEFESAVSLASMGRCVECRFSTAKDKK